jgi:hypothetical protein
MVMSRTTQTPKRPGFTAGLLIVASLAAPLAISEAQGPSPERALLNVIPVGYRLVGAGVESIPLDGDRALLGRTAATTWGSPSRGTESREAAFLVDGERALRTSAVGR